MSFFKEIVPFKDKKYVNGLTSELEVIYIYNKFLEGNNSIICLTSTLYEANKVFSSLSNYTKDVLLFPMDEFLTSEALSTSPELKINRLETLKTLINDNKKIVITSLMGYLRFLPSRNLFTEKVIKLKKNDKIDLASLSSSLFDIGYEREVTVNRTGDVSVRGFVIDVFSISYNNPIRIEFWGDEIESIRYFDVNNQLTIESLDEVSIYPVTEFLTNKEIEIEKRKQKNLDKYEKVESIIDYLQNPIIFYFDKNRIDNNYFNLQEEILNYDSMKEEKASYMNKIEDINVKTEYYLNILDDSNKDSINFNSKTPDLFYGNLQNLKHYLIENIKKKKTIVICLNNRYQINNLIERLEEIKTIFTNEEEIFDNSINLIFKKINEGFVIDDKIVLSENEIFNKTNNSFKYKSNFKYGTRIKDVNKLVPGDYVVNVVHGIGKYLGLKTLVKNGFKKDYLQIEYANNDKLYIPVEKLELISKYSSKEGYNPKLNRLGSVEWEKTKARVKNKVENIALELLDLYSKRESIEGFAFKPDDENQLAFENEFNYVETTDQLRVIDEIKRDMESKKPMDRILCGDVGFGKTEVAFRAIFKAILSGKQAAILCPTTILSNQHYLNAIERFSSFPVEIAILNRFVTPKKVKEILTRLKEGKIDLLIGTHRILSNDIMFKNLGLLVVDEEQRFGVKHKEAIKKYKNNIDVLSLSATPIPRTLQMSMTGLRSLSLIETPPSDRYPIQTFVLEENDYIIKDAIYKEMNRGGQVFVLFNNIKNINEVEKHIKNLVKEARVIHAHGKMDKRTLEKRMSSFINKEYDVLVSTSIIETGIDIPNANTLIIIDADRYGLSQLYQIRGRVGRSNKIAYCYLMYNKRKILSEIAIKRLQVIKDFTELGSGLSIAMRDLSIRGAGDLLGSEQAGFIDSVGIEMFMHMLNNEVSKLKGTEIKEEEKPSEKSLINVETSIDSVYISEEEIKIEIHKKINTIDSLSSIKELVIELEDRFGKVSENLKVYMYQEWFEKLANSLNIKNINQTKNFIEIEMPSQLEDHLDGKKLFEDIVSLGKMFRFKKVYSNNFIVLDIVRLDKHFIYYLIDLLLVIKDNIKK